ncbi:MAG: FAD-dependent oxidoreductase [Candidatus Omnitrophota bacterium]
MKVVRTVWRAEKVVSVSMEPENGAVETFKAGQFMQLSVGDGKELTRYLSISNSPTEKGILEATKKLTGSLFSDRFSALAPGSEVRVKYPMGNLTLDEGRGRIAFLSGGIGITPIRGMLRFISDTNAGTDCVLIYANRTYGDIVFFEDLADMSKKNQKFRIVHTLSSAPRGWKGRVGRIDRDMISVEVPDYRERLFYVCGPPGMVSAMTDILRKDLNVSHEMIKTENFIGY